MKKIGYRVHDAYVPSEPLLDGVSVAPLTATVAGGSGVQAAVFRLRPDARIRRHPAALPQLVVVLQGRGESAGGAGATEAIAEGDAVYFDAGEEHETRAVTRLTLLVIEGSGLLPVRRDM